MFCSGKFAKILLPECVQNPDNRLRKFVNNCQFHLPPNAVQKGPQHTYEQKKNFSEHENEFHEYWKENNQSLLSAQTPFIYFVKVS